jgi:hypothetical protein
MKTNNITAKSTYLSEKESKYYTYKIHKFNEVKGKIRSYINQCIHIAERSLFFHRLGSCLVRGKGKCLL